MDKQSEHYCIYLNKASQSRAKVSTHFLKRSAARPSCTPRFPQLCLVLQPNGHLSIIKKPSLECAFLRTRPKTSSKHSLPVRFKALGLGMSLTEVV